MKPKEWTIFVLTFVLIAQVNACILCPYRIPPKVIGNNEVFQTSLFLAKTARSNANSVGREDH
jgi:hypothetical protein